MTVTNTSARNTAAVGNGSTVLFPTGFEFFDSDELLVYKRVTATGVETLQIEGTDYTVTGGAGAEGTVDFTVDTDSFGDPYPPPATEEVHIIRNTDRNQPEDLTPSQVLPSAAIERGMDRSVMRDQDDELQVSKALRAPITDSSGLDMELPSSVARASKVLGFDSAGEPVATTQADQSALTVVATGSTTARTHAERWGEVANVKDFGAIGNGVVDDTAAIQAAINSLSAGGTAFFPKGTYLVSENGSTGYCVLINASMRIVGAGLLETTIKVAASQDTNIFSATSINGIYVGYLTVDGNKSNQSATDNRALYFLTCDDLDFEYVRVVNATGHGFFISAGGGAPSTASFARFNHCISKDNGKTGAATDGSGFATNGERVSFTACSSSGNLLAGFKSTGDYVKYQGCDAYSNGKEGFSGGFDATPGKFHFYSNCHANNNGADGFRFASQVDKIVVTNSAAYENNWSGICSLNTTEDLIVAHCILQQNGASFVADATTRGAGVALLDTSGAANRVILSGLLCSDYQGTPTQTYGIEIDDDAANITISGDNRIGTHLTKPISITTTSSNVRILSGVSGITSEAINGTLTSHTGNTAETDLVTHTINGGEVTESDTLKVVVGGTVTGTNGTKTVKLYVGSTAYTISSQVSGETQDWHAEANILMLNNYASQRVLVNAQEHGGTPYVAMSGLTENFASNVIIKCTATLGHASDTLTQLYFSVSRT